ncbi:glycerol-3-phosphate dehydrogenase/oxidase [Undibacterium sp. Ji49W]|uniref:glycerol-3-phosphate dehydrogenase/oxidase n=1 Tax=Undibacterium sp. Ji49W TaxID=3413040 RepID=UPI003BF0D95F
MKAENSKQGFQSNQVADLFCQDWDVLVIGGGITGAGILLEAARRGWKVLLVEQRDFAWGTSSRSSKLVHGGLRYMQQGKFGLTLDSVHERQRLLESVAGLVDPQSFAFGDYKGRKPGRWLFSFGLAIYDWMAGRQGKKQTRRYHRAQDFLMLAPHIDRRNLLGGLCYQDAKTDDARLVLRVLQEAGANAGQALNYVGVDRILYRDGLAYGASLIDARNKQRYEVQAKVIINATGAWAEKLCSQSTSLQMYEQEQQQVAPHKLRPLRGSHLLLPAWRLPVAQAVSFMHPRDGRPVFAYPWEGVSLVGTTDVDHHADLQTEASITAEEVNYLMEALDFQFPQLQIRRSDIISCYAGVRPVIDSGKADPSKEGRDHAIWLEKGLLTVTGGKLTTFRLIALDVMKQIASLLPAPASAINDDSMFKPADDLSGDVRLDHARRTRLQGHYGTLAAAVLEAAREGELDYLPGTLTMWVELRWAARHEAVHHLEDLLLRRTRIGLLLRHGGLALLPRIRLICQTELGWDDAYWELEQAAYLQLWNRYHALPGDLIH